MSKVTKEILKEMKELRKMGARYDYLAARYKLHYNTVYNALNKAASALKRQALTSDRKRALARGNRNQDFLAGLDK